MGERIRKIWDHPITGWGCWLVFCAFLLRFALHIPTTGKAVAFLAVAAALMGSLWGALGHVAKLCWVLMLFAFLYVEMRAIDQDKIDSAKALGGYFQQISSDANANLGRVMKGQQDAFVLTMKELIRAQNSDAEAQRRNTRQFAALLKRQEDLFNQQHEMSESLNGHLIPGDTPTASLQSLSCEMWVDVIKPDEYFIQLGNAILLRHSFPAIPLGASYVKNGAELGVYQPLIKIDKNVDGILTLSLDVRASDGSIIVRFDKDGFRVGPNYIRGHPDKSTLLVEDLHGKQVLKVVYVNKHFLTVAMDTMVDGYMPVNTAVFHNLCLPQFNSGPMGLELYSAPPQ